PLSSILTESDASKHLIFIARSYFRSEVLENFLTSLFISLYFVFDINERKLIIVSKITYLISRVYHKNFTSLEELQLWAKTNKHPSIWKLLVVNLLDLVI
ncbi:MAG: hypothetical protein R3321_09055, partial [Nitrososphaeraceae archaeon]|nr:hypothetical protein [Nitrososphaeraceae archaeon]